MSEFVQVYSGQVGLLMVVLVVWLGVEYFLFKRKGKVIGCKELTQLINHQDACLIDLRSRKDYEKGHIRHAIQCEPKGVVNRIEDVGSDRPVILYCGYGTKASHIAQTLYEKGRRNVYRLRGGIVSWTSENLPLSKDKK